MAPAQATSTTFRIPAGHPSLPGHFPGQPIVPGAVLLDHALAHLARQHPGLETARLSHVKFLHPVTAGRLLTLRQRTGTRGDLILTLLDGETAVLEASLPAPGAG
ncbi:MAG: hypothetical protein LPK58_07055 [Gammaproteobacteria bacterium]|nr:hypothetical protein [Gammaproteobacteria bacterium]